MSGHPTGGGPSAAEVERIVHQVLSSLGPGNLAKRAVGIGQPQHGKPAGAMNAEWRSMPLNGTGTYIIPHSLGVKPVSVTLKRVDHVAATPATVTAHAYQPDQWTNQSVSVYVDAAHGTIDGIGWFLIEGA